jgi:hypothetical protein
MDYEVRETLRECRHELQSYKSCIEGRFCHDASHIERLIRQIDRLVPPPETSIGDAMKEEGWL